MKKIAKDVYKMRLEGDTSHITAPGQFVNIKLDGKFLRRPISVCDCEENVITIIYKVVGEGTEQMSNLKIGKMLMCSQVLATATIFQNRLSRFLSAVASVFRQCNFLAEKAYRIRAETLRCSWL